MANMDAKQIRLLVAVLVAVVCFVAMRFGYTPISEKAETVEAENVQLEQELNSLKLLAANEADFKAQCENVDVKYDAIVDKYPSKVTPEKSIKFVKEMEESTGVEVSNIAFNVEENIYSSSFTNENGESILGYVSGLQLSYKTTYDGLKKMMDYINLYSERMNVKEFSAAYNQETGKLTGTVLINRYSLTGFGKEYEAPVISDVNISTGNIFSTVD